MDVLKKQIADKMVSILSKFQLITRVWSVLTDICACEIISNLYLLFGAVSG